MILTVILSWASTLTPDRRRLTDPGAEPLYGDNRMKTMDRALAVLCPEQQYEVAIPDDAVQALPHRLKQQRTPAVIARQ